MVTLLVCFLSLHAGLRVWLITPAFPAPSLFRGTYSSHNSGAGAPRECLLVPRTQRSVKRCAAESGPMKLLGACLGPGSAVHRVRDARAVEKPCAQTHD